MKLNQLKKLLEAKQLTIKNGMLTAGFGLVFPAAENIDINDLDSMEVYVEQSGFIKRLGELYDYSYNDEEPLDISDLHDDPDIKKQLKNKMGKRQPKKLIFGEDCTTMAQLKALPNWSQFCDHTFVHDRF